MTELTPMAVSAAPLLRAIAAQAFATMTELADQAGRKRNNMARDLANLAAAGWILREPEIVLTDAGREVLATLGRTAGGPPAAAPASAAPGIEGIVGLVHAQILPSHRNPRRDWDSEDAKAALAELAASIKAEGRVLQNLVVRPAPAAVAEIYHVVDGQGRDLPLYELVAGERRHRAVALLIAEGDWPQDRPLPAMLTDLDDAGHDRVALIENLKRRDLKPLEEAQAFKRLVDGGMKTAELAEVINCTQRLVQQRLQLLELDDKDQQRLDRGELTIEQARQIIARRPTPIEVTPEQAVIFLECAHAAAAAGGMWKKVIVDCRLKDAVDAEGDPAQILNGRAFLSDDWQSGHTRFEFSYGCHTLLRQLTGTDELKVSALKEPMRAAQLAVVHQFDPRANPLSRDYRGQHEVLDELTAGGRYLTPFLNAPHLKDMAHVELVERRKKDDEERNRLYAQQRAEAEAKEQRKTRNAARVRALGLKFDDKALCTPEIVDATLDDFGHPLPWRWTPPSDGEYGQLTDANGEDISLDGYDADDLLAFVMAAVNAAGGHGPVVAERPAEADEDAEETEDGDPADLDRPAFVGWIATALQESFPHWKSERCRSQAGHVLDGYLKQAGIAYGDEGYVWNRGSATDIADEAAETLDEADDDAPDGDDAFAGDDDAASPEEVA